MLSPFAHRDIGGIDIVRARVVIHVGEFDSRVVVGQDVGVAVLGPVLCHERCLLAVVQSHLCHSLEEREGEK